MKIKSKNNVTTKKNAVKEKKDKINLISIIVFSILMILCVLNFIIALVLKNNADALKVAEKKQEATVALESFIKYTSISVIIIIAIAFLYCVISFIVHKKLDVKKA